MGDMNGNSFELGRVVGHLQATMDRNTDQVEHLVELNIRQATALERMGQDIRDLPARMTDARATPMLSQLTEFIRHVTPPALILLVLVVKVVSPETLPVIRDIAASMR